MYEPDLIQKQMDKLTLRLKKDIKTLLKTYEKELESELIGKQVKIENEDNFDTEMEELVGSKGTIKKIKFFIEEENIKYLSIYSDFNVLIDGEKKQRKLCDFQISLEKGKK